jgi:LysR family cys regulon transcriptional activator
LRDLAQYSIVTYEFSLSGAYSISSQFETAGLSLDVSLTARDADVIKTYVRVGLGIGAG